VHERNYEEYNRHRNDKGIVKGLKEDMEICRTKCEDMKADIIIKNEEHNV
jgi:hypothetical protein